MSNQVCHDFTKFETWPPNKFVGRLADAFVNDAEIGRQEAAFVIRVLIAMMESMVSREDDISVIRSRISGWARASEREAKGLVEVKTGL